MKKNKSNLNISSKDINRGIVTLGSSALIGFGAYFFFAAAFFLPIILIVFFYIIIDGIIKVNKHRKADPVLNELDNCPISEFVDKASEVVGDAFSNGYVLMNDYEEGTRNINFSFLQSDDYITYDEVLKRILNNTDRNRGIVTNSRLNKDAASYCKQRCII